MLQTVLLPVGTHVGLQVLLQPYSGIIGRAACMAAGVVYPAYATATSLEDLQARRQTEGAEKWMQYWTSLAALTTAEYFLRPALEWVPYYHSLKLAALIWLQHSKFEGARRIHGEFLRPLLLRLRSRIDPILYVIFSSLAPRGEMAHALSMLRDGAAHVPVLEWLVRGPDGLPRQTGGTHSPHSSPSHDLR